MNETRSCTSLCTAYMGDGVKPGCRILNFMDRLLVVLKRPKEQPTAPQPQRW